MDLVLPMYNAHPYVFLKNLGKKSTHYTWQNMDNPTRLQGLLYFSLFILKFFTYTE